MIANGMMKALKAMLFTRGGLLLLAGLGLAGGPIARLLCSDDYAIGFVTAAEPVPGGKSAIVLVESPWRAPVPVVLAEADARDLAGAWLVAKGGSRTVKNQTVIEAESAHRVAAPFQPALRTWFPVARSWAASLPPAWVAGIGAAVLALGLLVLRPLAALFLAVLGAGIGWHAAAVGACEGMWGQDSAAFAPLSVLGAALGLVLGGRRDGLIGTFARRLVAAGAAAALAPGFLDRLGVPVPEGMAGISTALLAGLSCPSGVVLSGTSLLAAGLDARGGGAAALLAAGIALVAGLHGSRAERWWPAFLKLPCPSPDIRPAGSKPPVPAPATRRSSTA